MLNLTDVLGWGSLDVKALEDYIKTAEKFKISSDDIKEDIRSYEGDATDINYWFYSTITLIFYEVMREIRVIAEKNGDAELIDKTEYLENNFDPFINYMDSWFGNCLDDIDFNQGKEEILNDVIEKLREDD